MARPRTPGTRDRILDVAARLFSEQGIRAVGLQHVIDECGCGKNLLYREFGGKDELVVAYLQRYHDEWTEAVDEAIRPLADDPAAQLVAMVQTVADEVAAPGFRGCPFVNTYAEFPDPNHPAHRLAVDGVNDTRARLQEIAERANADDPSTLADRLNLIIDGLYANGAVVGSNGAAASGVAFARDLVEAATRGHRR
jgi:AcrR family transcriptional regulator